MPAAIAVGRTREPARSFDPLEPLAKAIGSRLTRSTGKNQDVAATLLSQVTTALHQVLEARTPQSRSARMLLIRHLVDIETVQAGITVPPKPAAATELIGTAQAAGLLGYSRPYVAMLIDQNQLEGATVSAGGHRRVPRASVLAWKEKHQSANKTVDMRAEGKRIGAYKSSEAEAIRRIKALASSPK